MRLLKRSLFCAPLLALMVILVGLPAVAFGRDDDSSTRFSARLIGINEVPSINTDGTASLKLKLNSASMDFELSFHNLSQPPAAAHIHFGQARTNGGVMVFFCGGGGKPACPTTTSGTVTGNIVPTDVVGPAVQGIKGDDLASVMRAIREDAAYANMHTPNFPSGEIRGQIVKTDN
ncbi:MAG: CHRD domain-containing protein [Chloroflexota bacterium]|nr:CHRD domain-containing protein [Chloroflexota bacterium]